jgi:hypothetical protein
MDQQTSTSPVQLGNGDAARTAAKAVLRVQAAIPEQFRNKAPFGIDSRVASWFFDKFLPLIRFGKVQVDTFQYEGKPYHRVTLSVPFRTSTFVVNAFGAHGVTSTLIRFLPMTAFGMAMPNLLLQDFAGTGDIYVPGWAAPELAEDFMNLVRIHKARVEFGLDELRRSQLPFLGTDSDAEQDSKPTLH